MIDPSHYNMPGYSTRVAPTALIIWEYQGEIYTVLVQNSRGHRGWILPNGGIEKGETSQESAYREAVEEIGTIANPGVRLQHIGQLGSLFRKAGTVAKKDDEKEKALLSAPDNQGFLFLKQQIYELFILIGLEDQQLELSESGRDPDIRATRIVTLKEIIDNTIANKTDYEVIKIINSHVISPNQSLDTLLLNLNSLQYELKLHQDTLFK